MNFRTYFTCFCLIFLALGCEPTDAPIGGAGPDGANSCSVEPFPCDLKAYGEACSLCDPTDTNCVEAEEAKVCTPLGCQAGGIGSFGCNSSDSCLGDSRCSVEWGACETTGVFLINGISAATDESCIGHCIPVSTNVCDGLEAGACCNPCEDEAFFTPHHDFPMPNSFAENVCLSFNYACTEEGICQPLSVSTSFNGPNP